jgi:hypothetical protein
MVRFMQDLFARLVVLLHNPLARGQLATQILMVGLLTELKQNHLKKISLDSLHCLFETCPLYLSCLTIFLFICVMSYEVF